MKTLVLDFPNYIRALSDMISNSKPKYTIGIFGNWGSGKTTLMRNVSEILSKKGCNCIEFNAWRYALEERHATFPLMLEIITCLLDVDEIKTKQNSTLQNLKKNALRIARGLKITATVKTPFLDLAIESDVAKTLEKKSEDDTQNLQKNKPILQEGLETIQNLLQFVEGLEKNPDLKLIIFIDDLDRCVPEKVTEIFESIKVFFDMTGIVFVLGLSHEIVEEAINQRYKMFGESFSGKDYLKKIIQVPFPLPTWTTGDIVDYVKSLISNHDDTYKAFFSENLGMIARTAEPNPREVKRLLNNFILSHQIHKNNPKIDQKKLFLIHAIAHRWRSFYNQIMGNPSTLKTIITEYEKAGNHAMESEENEEGTYGSALDAEIKGNPWLNDVEDIERIMNFITNDGEELLKMDDTEFKLYRRATIIEPEIETLEKIKQKPVKIKSRIELIPLTREPDQSPIETRQFWKYGGSVHLGRKPKLLMESLEIEVNSSGIIKFEYRVPVNFRGSSTSHTSSLILHISIDETYLGFKKLGYQGQSPQLPLDTGILSITNLPPGKHFLNFQPELPADDVVGTYLDNWGGTVDFY